MKFLPTKSVLPAIGMSLEKSTSIPMGPGFGKASDPEMNRQDEQQPPKPNPTHLRKQGDHATSSDFSMLT